jgi:high-affinity nickel permease
LFFALGHSSVVIVVGVGITPAAGSVFNTGVTPNTTFSSTAGVLGTALSGTFLYLIAAMNLVVLIGIVKLFPVKGGRQATLRLTKFPSRRWPEPVCQHTRRRD